MLDRRRRTSAHSVKREQSEKSQDQSDRKRERAGWSVKVSGSSTPSAVTSSTRGGLSRPNTASTALAPRVNNARSAGGANDPDSAPGATTTRDARSTPVRVKRHSQATSPLPGSGRTCDANPARRHISRARRTASGANATKPDDDASRPHPINDASRRQHRAAAKRRPPMRSQRPVTDPSGCRPAARTACTTATRRHHQQCKAAN